MDMKEWINKSLPDVVGRLESGIASGFHIHSEEGLNLAGRSAIYEVLDDILAVLFPGAYSRERVAAGELNFYLGDLLRHITFRLSKQIAEVFRYHCPNHHPARDCGECDCRDRAQRACRALVEDLPAIREALVEDLDAAYEGDPAARSLDEIALSYPCIEAIATYRVAHKLYELEVPILPRIMSERAHSHTGIDIHPGARIGPHFFIDHGTGVVIGETTRIGRNVKLYQGVTLGALSPLDRKGRRRDVHKRHPDIEDDVIVYANATILGGETVIGTGAVIGGNTWITESVAPGAVIYSNGTT